MPVKKDVRDLPRRDVRYRLYRIKSGDPLVKDDGLKKHFESQDEFDGWHNFGRTWDTGPEGDWPEGHFTAVPLRMSLEAQWQKTLLGLVEDFPLPEDKTENNTCMGTTVEGEPCSKTAGESGYCHLHELDDDEED